MNQLLNSLIGEVVTVKLITVDNDLMTWQTVISVLSFEPDTGFYIVDSCKNGIQFKLFLVARIIGNTIELKDMT